MFPVISLPPPTFSHFKKLYLLHLFLKLKCFFVIFNSFSLSLIYKISVILSKWKENRKQTFFPHSRILCKNTTLPFYKTKIKFKCHKIFFLFLHWIKNYLLNYLRKLNKKFSPIFIIKEWEKKIFFTTKNKFFQFYLKKKKLRGICLGAITFRE